MDTNKLDDAIGDALGKFCENPEPGDLLALGATCLRWIDENTLEVVRADGSTETWSRS